jgi:hypothetical protein
MASNLRVDQITASTTGSVSIGTATFTGGLSGDITGLNVTGVITATTLNQNVTGVVTATGGFVVGTGATISGSTNTITASTNGNERVRINSSGNVGIGTDNPTSKLEVYNSSSTPVVKISGPTSGSSALEFYASTTKNGALLVNSSVFLIAADNSNPITFYTGGNEAARFNTSGNLAFPSGQGIDFSATSDASGMTSELLDDYEEGSFTPTDTSGASLSLTAYGRYTKVGNLLFCTFDVTYPTTSNTSAASISLPFSAGPINLQGSGSLAWQNFGSLLTVYMGSSGSSFSFRNPTDTGQSGVLNSAVSGKRLIGAITIRTT